MEEINSMDFVTFITCIKNKSLPVIDQKPRPKMMRYSACTFSTFITQLFSIYLNRDKLQFVDIDYIISSISVKSTNFYSDLENNFDDIIQNYNDADTDTDTDQTKTYDYRKLYDYKNTDVLDDSEFSDTTSIDESSLFSSYDEDYHASWNNRYRSLSST